MFRTSKCSSSGRILHAVLWYFPHTINVLEFHAFLVKNSKCKTSEQNMIPQIKTILYFYWYFMRLIFYTWTIHIACYTCISYYIILYIIYYISYHIISTIYHIIYHIVISFITYTISYHIMSCHHIISYHISYHIMSYHITSCHVIYIIHICQLQMCSHLEAAVQYTFTHKQYTEQNNRRKQDTEQHYSLISKSADLALSLRVIPWHLPYRWGTSTENPQSG